MTQEEINAEVQRLENKLDRLRAVTPTDNEIPAEVKPKRMIYAHFPPFTTVSNERQKQGGGR